MGRAGEGWGGGGEGCLSLDILCSSDWCVALSFYELYKIVFRFVLIPMRKA